MRFIISFLLFLSASNIFAQTGGSLKEYLSAHSYTIQAKEDGSLKADNKCYTRLDALINTKPVVVYGEGFSHRLQTNGYLESMFLEYLTQHHLKYIFGEQARSWVVVDDFYYHDPSVSAKTFYPDYKPESQQMLDIFKNAYRSGNPEYKAMDFERPSGFKTAIDTLMSRLAKNKRNELQQLAPFVADTSYKTLSAGKFVKFYEEQRDKFYHDSDQYKVILGELYPSYKYLVSDPEPSQYTDNRNKNMANHILWEIGTPEKDATYFITCGSAHAQRGKKDGIQKTTVMQLESSEALKGKILIANLYCEDCTPEPTQYGVGDNSRLGFMKDEVLMSFQQATGIQAITLFDLTELPKEYKYITDDYGDFLIYAKGRK